MKKVVIVGLGIAVLGTAYFLFVGGAFGYTLRFTNNENI